MRTENSCDIAEPMNSRQEFSANLEKAIQDIIVKEKFTESKIYKRQISTNGGSYMGDLYEVDIKGKSAQGEKEVNLFVKKLVVEAVEKIKKDFGNISIGLLYEIEAFAYKELYAVFKELQDEANVPEVFRYKIAKGYEESFNEAIILENLAKKGYKTGNRQDIVSYKFAKLSMEQLAKLHGLSFAIERLRPQYFEEKIKTIIYPVKWLENVDPFIEMTLSNIEDDDVKQRVKEFIPLISRKLKEYHVVENAPIRSLVHGDFRANNILSKEINGEVCDVIPVDFQTLNYGCPVNDFIYFIYMGTDQEFRDKYFNELKDVYYETMREFLQYFNIDVEEVFPRKLFEDTLRERKDYGLTIAIVFSTFIFCKDDDILDFGSQNVGDYKPTFVPEFQKRFKEIVDEYFDSK